MWPKEIHVPGNVHFRDFKAFCRNLCLYYPVKVEDPTTPIFQKNELLTLSPPWLERKNQQTQLFRQACSTRIALSFILSACQGAVFFSTVKEVNREFKFTSYQVNDTSPPSFSFLAVSCSSIHIAFSFFPFTDRVVLWLVKGFFIRYQ